MFAGFKRASKMLLFDLAHMAMQKCQQSSRRPFHGCWYDRKTFLLTGFVGSFIFKMNTGCVA